MNRKHDSACVESDSCPAKEREKVVLFWKHNLPRNYVNFLLFWEFFVLFCFAFCNHQMLAYKETKTVTYCACKPLLMGFIRAS